MIVHGRIHEQCGWIGIGRCVQAEGGVDAFSNPWRPHGQRDWFGNGRCTQAERGVDQIHSLAMADALKQTMADAFKQNTATTIFIMFWEDLESEFISTDARLAIADAFKPNTVVLPILFPFP